MMKTYWKPSVASFIAAALIWSSAVPAKAWLDGSPFSPNTTFIWHWQPVPLYHVPFDQNTSESQTTSKSGKTKRKARIKSSKSSSKTSGVSKKRPVLAKTSFRPDATVRKRNFARFVAKSREVDPQGAVQLEQVLASGNVMADISKGIAVLGLKTNDVADAMTLYLVAAWSGVRGRNDNPTRARCAAVRRQIAASVQTTPEFAKATDAQKQELAEAMLIQAVLVDQSITAAKDDAPLMDKLKAAIAQGAQRTFGLDLRRVQLTDAGIKLTSSSLQN